MPRYSRFLAISIAVLTGLSAAACTSSPAAVVTAPAEVDTSVFKGVEYDYMVFDSPAALAADDNVTAVFAGRVEEFSQGRTLSGPEVEDKHVVMKVSVDEAYKGAGDVEGFAYVEMLQPLCADDAPCSTVADFTEAVPAGTKVMVFGEDASEEAPPEGEYVDNEAGRPAGADLIQATPQGLLFESASADGTTVVGAYEKVEEMPDGWRDDLSAGIDGLETQLEAANLSN